MQFPPNSKQEPNSEPPRQPQQPPWRRWMWPALWLLLLIWLVLRVPEMISTMSGTQAVEIPYSLFFEQVNDGNVSEVIMQDTAVSGTLNRSITWSPDNSSENQVTFDRFTTTLLPVDDPSLTQALRDNNVTVVAQTVDVSPILLFLINFGPILLLLGFFVWQARRAQGQMSNVFGFGRSQAREYSAERPQITFTDVAGQDAAKKELVEIVDFLKEPDKYIALGARIPRGVLLVGPPGTGKTLMARAVAGEAHVAFFSLSASEFVEMFVGVGASRVRDLFNRAKSAAPSIVFIDELDAVGRRRGTGLGGGHDEREQTLNQLLSEMDGFDKTESVIVMAATNRPDVLDPALLRPGRFDRQVTVNLPDRVGREGILKIHTRDKPLASDVDLAEMAKATIGFSGADLANLANEAALTAARKSHRRIATQDFSDAFDRIIMGIESPPLSNEQERKVTAYHEAGHALVAALTPGADPVFKVTIIPRGQSLGMTVSSPSDDRRSYSREQLFARMRVMLGGRSAEEIAVGEIATGAENDLRRVTQLARRMVVSWGMSEAIGPLNFGEEDHQPFLGYSLTQPRDYSEETSAKIDAEIKRLVEEAHEQARDLLGTHRKQLEALAQELLENEMVDRARVLEIANMTEPELEQA